MQLSHMLQWQQIIVEKKQTERNCEIENHKETEHIARNNKGNAITSITDAIHHHAHTLTREPVLNGLFSCLSVLFWTIKKGQAGYNNLK